MGIHHLALVTSDIEATHAFYTTAMGFELAKVVTAPTPTEGDGWARHVFYSTGDGGLIAFWDLHDTTLPTVRGAMSRDVGLPEWVSHVAFDPGDEAGYEAAKKRWLDLGIDIIEVDHGFCRSIYAIDPNGTMVEWCLDTRPLDENDRESGLRALSATTPELEEPPVPVVHRADHSLRPAWLK